MAKIVNRTMMITYRFMHVSKTYYKNIIVRKPVKVLNLPPEQVVVENIRIKNWKNVMVTERDVDGPAIIKKPEENIVAYEKLTKYDKRFIKTVSIIKDRTRREKSGKILLEGKRLINDAIKAGMQMNSLFFSREEDLRDINIKDPKEVEVCKVLYRTLKVWSNLTKCPGVFAVFKRPNAEELNVLSSPTIPVTILCDNIREPGNLGSIIRNAAAAGCKNILLIKGCVDPWEMKVLRAGCGGQFRIPVINNIEWSQISNYIPSTSTIFVADNSADIEEVSLGPDFINYDEYVDKDEEEESRYFTFNEDNKPIRVDETFDSPEEIEKYKEISLPCHIYSSLKYPKDDIVLYVGGETCGVDPRIVKLACEFGGRKIKVPMENETESLNSAFAATIILYEIKRQLSQVYVAPK